MMDNNIIKAAMRARRERNNLRTLPISFKVALKEDIRGKYITPAAMAILLDCDFHDLCEALSMHKKAIGKMLYDQNYGNCNYVTNAVDAVKLQGWINFLSLPCFEDSLEAKEVVRLAKEENKPAI